ncbi:hypothetical protein ACVDG3_18675 [Meridianimarinicoccus sp. RP-17]|uniref:hypothetical protein n=1 Tax=Meridianimarinicoccus zhengii TaxID=2056810 RepID=UPI0013A6E0CD|nr:hypothetical protein [Phycocomes zhengii]
MDAAKIAPAPKLLQNALNNVGGIETNLGTGYHVAELHILVRDLKGREKRADNHR